MLRAASRQDLGDLGTIMVGSFLGSIMVQFRAVLARHASRCPLSGTQLRSMKSSVACASSETNTGNTAVARGSTSEQAAFEMLECRSQLRAGTLDV